MRSTSWTFDRIVSSLLVVTTLLVAGLAAPVAEWTAPAGCPDSEAVYEAAEAFGASVRDASLNLEGRIEPVDGGFRLDLSIRTPTGTTTRELHAESCDELIRAAGLVLSVAVDPLHVPEPRLEPAAPPPTPIPVEPAEARPTSAEAPPIAAAQAPSSPPPTSPPTAVSGLASGTLGRGLVPDLDARAQLGLALDTPRLRAELLGTHIFAQDVDAADRPGVGAKIQGWGGSLRVGPQWDVGAVSLAFPAGVELVAIVGDGFGVDRAWKRADLAWSVLVAPGMRILLSRRVAVGADVELSVALRRPAFAVATPQLLYRTPRLGARAGARIEVRFSGAPRDQNRTRRRRR